MENEEVQALIQVMKDRALALMQTANEDMNEELLTVPGGEYVVTFTTNKKEKPMCKTDEQQVMIELDKCADTALTLLGVALGEELSLQAERTRQQESRDSVLYQIESLEAEIRLKVEAELDAKGKKLFGNDRARKDEIRRRLETSPFYGELVSDRDQLREHLSRIDFEIQTQMNLVTVQKATLRLLTARMTLLAAALS